ncbi:MAG TPA: hypothetical protein VK933_15640, partial [Longimicrobiales bacterium]|nr:hypothetical protein [Longimicrobiales bacterium]
PRTLRRRVVLGMLPTAALGIAIGAALSLAISRFLQALLYATEPTDPVAFATGSVLLLLVSVVAAYQPARRASTLDPATALRAGS